MRRDLAKHGPGRKVSRNSTKKRNKYGRIVKSGKIDAAGCDW